MGTYVCMCQLLHNLMMNKDFKHINLFIRHLYASWLINFFPTSAAKASATLFRLLSLICSRTTTNMNERANGGLVPNVARHFHVMRQSRHSQALSFCAVTRGLCLVSHVRQLVTKWMCLIWHCAVVSRVPPNSHAFIVLCLCMYNASA